MDAGKLTAARTRALRVLPGAALFAGLMWARTHGITESFWLLGEQIRDWTVALGAWHDLPFAGTPSTAGGTSLGPIFYWALWATRVTIGPLFDNLPHTGAIGIALLHSAADVALFIALWRRTSSILLALTVVLLAATGPYELALSAMIWNPPLSVALVKAALAMFLVSADHPSRLRMAGTVALAWLAVQAHSSAIFVFLPLASWFVIRGLLARQWRHAAQTARLLAEIVLVLQLPYLIGRLTATGATGAPTVAMDSALRLVSQPESINVWTSLQALRGSLNYSWGYHTVSNVITAALAAGAAATIYFARRTPWIVFVTLLPLAASVVAFSTWDRPFEAYWYLTLAPCAALMIGQLALVAPAGTARHVAAGLLLAVVLWQVPGRVTKAHALLRLPEYGTLIKGTREIARRTGEVRDIFTEFELPPSTDRTFPFICMGGRVHRDAPYNAFIARDGSVSFRSTRPE